MTMERKNRRRTARHAFRTVTTAPEGEAVVAARPTALCREAIALPPAVPALRSTRWRPPRHELVGPPGKLVACPCSTAASSQVNVTRRSYHGWCQCLEQSDFAASQSNHSYS